MRKTLGWEWTGCGVRLAAIGLFVNHFASAQASPSLLVGLVGGTSSLLGAELAVLGSLSQLATAELKLGGATSFSRIC